MNAAFRPPTASQKINLQELGIYLERIENQERMAMVSSVAEVFVKDFGGSKPSEIAHVSQMIEAAIFAKYSDSGSPNYKTISKRILSTLKSKQDIRSKLIEKEL